MEGFSCSFKIGPRGEGKRVAIERQNLSRLLFGPAMIEMPLRTLSDWVYQSPKGPNLEKNQSRLKFSILLENFKIA